MRISQIRNRFNNFSWKRALVSLGIGIAIILGGGIPLAISHGMIGFFSYSAIVVALYASYVSIKSLQLARNTQRPFLNVLGYVSCHTYTASLGQIAAVIRNSGIFPADEVSVHCGVFKNKKSDNEHLLLQEGNIPAIHFPNEENKCVFGETPDEKKRLTINYGDVLRVHITINYKNKLTQNKHKTVRCYSMVFDSKDETKNLIPCPQEDYWD